MDLLTQRLLMSAGSRVPAVLETGIGIKSSTVPFTTTPAANTLILFFGQRSGSDVSLPTGYTVIAQRTGANCRFLCAYKIAVGTETSITSTGSDVNSYAFVSVGASLDKTGAVATSTSAIVTADGLTALNAPITPSLAFLVSAVNGDSSTVSIDDNGWTEIINSTLQTSNRELVVYAKEIVNGASTPNITVTWDANTSVAVQFSIK